MEDYQLLDEQLNEIDKLVKKSKKRLISFFFIIAIDLFIFISSQSNSLFFFKLNRSEDSVTAYGSYHLISWILMGFILLFFISYVCLFIVYLRKERVEDSVFKKIYNFFDFFTVIPIFFLIVMILNSYVYTIAVVDGPSMEPTYYTSDVVVIGYHYSVNAEDVIVFEKDKLYIKRVIAKPLDLLVVRNGEVWVNGDFIDYTNGDFTYEGILSFGEYFVMGDNRSNSSDSRHFGLVTETEIIGRVILD